MVATGQKRIYHQGIIFLLRRVFRAAKSQGWRVMGRIVLFTATFSLVANLFSGDVSAASGDTLKDVKVRGVLRCGVNSALAGFSAPNDKGELVGFDVDYCRAVAAATLGDSSKVSYKLLTGQQRLPALQTGEVDVLVRNTTWSLSRDVQGMNFRAVNYYDGQGFMVRKSLGVTNALQLNGASVCLQSGTTTELNLADYFNSKGMAYKSVVFERVEEVGSAYDSGRCDVYTADASALYSLRLVLSAPDDHVILPDIISKEPMGPVVREGDDHWFDIVSWVHYALLEAEELGVTQANVKAMGKSSSADTRIRRLLGSDNNAALSSSLGLERDWVVSVVAAVGNYGEIFERNLGAGSQLKISRNVNALWFNGGLQYAPPFR